jgi:hypothetical protein
MNKIIKFKFITVFDNTCDEMMKFEISSTHGIYIVWKSNCLFESEAKLTNTCLKIKKR